MPALHAVSAHSPAVPAAQFVAARFLILATVDPGLLPRLLEPIAKLGEVPTRVHASRESGDGSEITVDLRVGGLSPRTVELIECGLRRIVGVRQLIAVVEPRTSGLGDAPR
jgi:hypothetical protein